jgi:hypothetical protein
LANHYAVTMPISTEQMIDDLIRKHRLSIKEIAHILGVSTRTIYRLQSNDIVSNKLLTDLMGLYCRVALIQSKASAAIRSRCKAKKPRR